MSTHAKLTSALLGLLLLSLPSTPSAQAQPLGQGKLATADEEKRLQERYVNFRKTDPEYVHAGEETLERWMDWKWGLRIHWGLYCMFDGGESWILVKPEPKPREWQMNYYASYQQFNPTNFNADEWMRIMERAGMKYFSFTSKHHEGFCLYPTKTLQKGFRKKADGTYEDVVDHYSIAETPFKRDIIGELVKAGRAHHLGVSLYYSHIDWHDWDFGWDERNFWYDPKFTKESDPQRWAAFIKKERDQITELLTWYGPIDTLCLDIRWPAEAQEDAFGVARLARQLQPNIMLRNRGINDYGDYETPEKQIPEDPNQMKRPWQVIYPGSSGFSYKRDDKYKPQEWVLESLIDIVSKGGNFQVGFGPDPTGKWPQEMIDRVSYVGDWLKVNNECIFATRPYLRYHEGADLRFTRTKDKKYVYVISLKWPGDTLSTRLAKAKPGSAIRLLGYPQDLAWKQSGDQLVIEMPKALQSETARPCKQAYAFKVESEDWTKFTSALPDQPPLPEDPTYAKKSSKSKEPAVKLPEGAIGINFQPKTTPVPKGFLADYGELFGAHADGRRYGWNRDHADQVRQRTHGQVTDTFCHFRQGGQWSIELPNGLYQVTVGVGDISHESRNTINVGGVNFCANLSLKTEVRALTKPVEVKDGKLTVDCGEARDKATKITHLIIAGAPK